MIPVPEFLKSYLDMSCGNTHHTEVWTCVHFENNLRPCLRHKREFLRQKYKGIRIFFNSTFTNSNSLYYYIFWFLFLTFFWFYNLSNIVSTMDALIFWLNKPLQKKSWDRIIERDVREFICSIFISIYKTIKWVLNLKCPSL